MLFAINLSHIISETFIGKAELFKIERASIVRTLVKLCFEETDD
jgi:hypothetical protein